MTMNCASTQELLPWMLNDSLSAEDARQVRAHLDDCADCRRELEETRIARAVFDAHIPTEALVAYAWDDSMNLPTEMVETHLAECQSCAEELSLLRQGRHAEQLAADAPPVAAGGVTGTTLIRPVPVWLRWLPIAASVIAAVAVAGWMTAQLQLSEMRQLAQGPGAPVPETVILTPERYVTLTPVTVTRGERNRGLEAAEPVLLGFPLEELDPEAGPFRLELLDENGSVVATYADRPANADLEVVQTVPPEVLAGARVTTARLTARDGESVLYGLP